MMLPSTEHTSRPWRIHELTRDFRLEDVWALPTPGGRDDFPQLVQLMASSDPTHASPAVVRTLAPRARPAFSPPPALIQSSSHTHAGYPQRPPPQAQRVSTAQNISFQF